MIILAYIWFIFIILSVLFLVVAGIIEKNFDEEHSIKKWWRKHVIGVAPDDVDL